MSRTIDKRIQLRGLAGEIQHPRYRSKIPGFGKHLTSQFPRRNGFKKATE